MPIYEFRCPKCNGHIEEIRCVSDMDRPCECPKCSREAGRSILAERIVTAPAGQFPGAASWR